MAKLKPKVKIRKPPAPVSLASVDAFVTGERSSVQTSGRSRSVVDRRDGRELRRMTVYLPSSLAKRLAMRAVELDADMSAVVAEAVERHLSAHG